ncbi:DUF6397 family protein [Streptomyces sp. NPDC059639]|uniref:DUF6397 family protein n=1 Tax=Streptomyces sp. NPDC059639 TaxID=3346891 RepID=UPI0036910505
MTRPQGSAARELGLKRGEFDLAVRLGRIRTVAAPDGGLRRVPREEIDRIREAEGFPDALREQVRVVGTAQGAAIMDIPSTRFTRLARAGMLTPAKFYINRYKTVVWLYLAQELREFARSEVHAPLLTGRAPAPMRARIAAGEDLRPRTWRARHAVYLLGQCADPWERAAAIATFLDADQLAELVESPYERAQLLRLRPHESWYGAPESPTAQVVERILVADDPDEISWLRANLLLSLDKARRLRPASHPAAAHPAVPHPAVPRPVIDGLLAPANPASPENFTVPAPAEPARSLWGRLLGRRG